MVGRDLSGDLVRLVRLKSIAIREGPVVCFPIMIV